MPEITYLKVNTSFLAFKIKQIMKDYVKRQFKLQCITQLTLGIKMHAVPLTSLNYCVMSVLMLMKVVLLKIEMIHYIFNHVKFSISASMVIKCKVSWSQLVSENRSPPSYRSAHELRYPLELGMILQFK